MASKQQSEASVEDVGELLDTVDKTLDRLKTLYEQYFLGIQKQPPTFIHSDVERKLRDLTQLQLRNTGLRYRLATLQQKFGSYNSYWRRTLRQIENGTYLRNLSKIGREAVRSGAEIPDEILAAMPKRMREQVLRDREQAIAIAKRRNKPTTNSNLLPPEPTDDAIAMIKEPTDVRRSLNKQGGALVLDESDADIDIDAFFEAVRQGTIPPPLGSANVPPPKSGPQFPRPTLTPTAESPASGPQSPAAGLQRPGTGPGAVTPPLTPSQRPATGGQPAIARPATGGQPAVPRPATGGQPAVPRPATGEQPAIPRPPTGAIPPIPRPGTPPPVPPVPPVPRPMAASQQSRPNPIAPGAAAAHGSVGVESMAGPFPRERFPTPVHGVPAQAPPTPAAAQRATPPQGVPAQRMTPAQGVPAYVGPSQTGPVKRAQSPGPQKPPPGMSDADVNALYAKYVKAKEMVGEKIGPGEHSKLLRTINAQAPKIMEQYKAKGVDFSVVVKDNQVIIRAKPKT